MQAGQPCVVQFAQRAMHSLLSAEQLKQLGELVAELMRGVSFDCFRLAAGSGRSTVRCTSCTC